MPAFQKWFSWILLSWTAVIPLRGLHAQTPPEKFLGFRVGADRRLADYGQITAYLKQLSTETKRIKWIEIGTSTLKKPMHMAVISSEENMANLDAYRRIAGRLRDPLNLAPEEARRLAVEGKVILLITCNIHSTEVASSQMAMELAYKLVIGDTPFPAEKTLRDVIVLLIPSTNPDGLQMVCDWYRRYLGTSFEGGRMPYLYHPYAGHDNNRDWFMFNLEETRAVTRVLFHDWFPQIHIDEHQMNSNGARLFIPPFMDPPTPEIQPLLWREIALFGTGMAFDLEQKGYTGVVHRRNFTGWWIGACDDTSWLHNVVGLLSEAASVRIATPVYIEPTEVEKTFVEKRIDFPNPWPGGWWRLRDIVDYELELSFSLIKTASLHKEDFLLNFYRLNRNSLEKRGTNEPFAFIVPPEQNDGLTAHKMLEIMDFGGIEIHQATESFTADRKLYPAGSFVVLMSQPYKPYAQTLLGIQHYPDLRENQTLPPVPPYDNAGWTLPLQMGVTVDRIETPFTAKLKKLSVIPAAAPAAPQASSPYWALDSRINASYSAAFTLLQSGVAVSRIRERIKRGGIDLAAGSFLIRDSPQARDAWPTIFKRRPVPCVPLGEASGITAVPLKNRRIALYQSYAAGEDEGWTRCVFDNFGVPYSVIHNRDFKKIEKTGLKSRFDVVIFPSENADIIKTGKPKSDSRWARYFTPLPPEFEGGIEKEGVAALKKFVAEGGILIALNEACELVIKEFQPPVQNTLEGIDNSKFFCPSSILRIRVDPDTPIGYGMSEESAALFADSQAFDTWVPSGDWDRKVVASFPKENILLSGWLTGEELIARKAAIVDLRYHKGRIILMGIRVQNRAQTHGTYKFLFNALLYPE